MALLNRVGHDTATTGTGTVTLGAAMTGHATVAEAGGVNATVYTYLIEEGDDFEIGRGTYTSSGTTFSRDTVILSKIGGTAGTSKMNLAGSATVKITAAKEDFESFGSAVSLTSTDAGAGAGPTFTLYRDSASPAASDVIGQVIFSGEDSAGNTQTYATIQSVIDDPTSTSEDGKLIFSVVTAGTLADELTITGTAISPAVNGGLSLGSDSLRFGNVNLNTGASVVIGTASDYIAFQGDTTNETFNLFNNAGTCVTFLMSSGTATHAPLKFFSGTNLSSIAAGAVEYDGDGLYFTIDTNMGRCVVNSELFACISADYTLTSSTVAQRAFDIETNGAVAVAASTLYQFMAQLWVTSMSGTSGNAGFDLVGSGTATLTSVMYSIYGGDGSADVGPLAASVSVSEASASLVPSITAGTGQRMIMTVIGAFRTNAAGTIIPSIDLQTAAAADVNANSFFRMWPVGTSSTESQGTWT